MTVERDRISRSTSSERRKSFVRALAERTGLPRSTVHLLCRTLVSEGLLEAVPRAGYRLGPLLLELGGLIIDRTGLVDAVEGSTAALQRTPGQELHVGQLVEGWVIYRVVE